MEFNELHQGEQEHPQIFLARLREAAKLENITNDALIESRFRAVLLRETNQFCIQSSSCNFQDRINHADGWCNGNRPRKIAMIENPFIPRNANQVLIYQDNNLNNNQYRNTHIIELFDTEEHPSQHIPISNIYSTGKLETLTVVPNAVTGSHQLTTIKTTSRRNEP